MAASRICSISNCGKNVYAKGLCNAHYLRLMRNGDPIGGRTAPGAILLFVHEKLIPSNVGECVWWPFSRDRRGYGKLQINGKLAGAHRYVCEAINGPPPTPEHQAAHSCGNGHLGCVNPRHLSWKTKLENEADKLVHGTRNRGERNGRSKITQDQVKEIRLLNGVKTREDIAEFYGVSVSTVSSIQCMSSWSWLQP